jgi:hypothetical protein
MPPKKRIKQSEEQNQKPKINLATADHFAAECIYCQKKWPRGRPQLYVDLLGNVFRK